MAAAEPRTAYKPGPRETHKGKPVEPRPRTH